MTDVLCLASASPRRRELLHQIGVAHCVRVPDVDESLHADETPEAYVQRLALAKAAAVFDAIDAPRAASGARLPVLAADTTVVVEGAVLGKPAERADFGRMLRKLSGREHRVVLSERSITAAILLTVLPSSSTSVPRATAAELTSSWEPVVAAANTNAAANATVIVRRSGYGD